MDGRHDHPMRCPRSPSSALSIQTLISVIAARSGSSENDIGGNHNPQCVVADKGVLDEHPHDRNPQRTRKNASQPFMMRLRCAATTTQTTLLAAVAIDDAAVGKSIESHEWIEQAPVTIAASNWFRQARPPLQTTHPCSVNGMREFNSSQSYLRRSYPLVIAHLERLSETRRNLLPKTTL